DAASRGMQGFVAAKRTWLDGQLAQAEGGALPALAEVLEQIQEKVRAETFAELPDLHARFAALDVAPLLARSLRTGLLDEFGWPVLEEVVRELDPDGKTAYTLHGGLPALIVATATKLVAVAHDRRLGEHDLVLPAKHEFVSARFVQGQFLVVIKSGWK